MFMTVSFFVNSISRPQRENLATVLQESVAAISRRSTPQKNASPKWLVPVPTSKEQMRSAILEGKYCIRQNLPHPKVYTDAEAHAYLKPSECVADCLAHGLLDGYQKTTTYESLVDCVTADDISTSYIKDDVRPVFLTLWSDDFEPNNLKDNRGSVWIQTLSIQTSGSGDLKNHHVYPIAVGPKNHDHFNVMSLIWDDLKLLKSASGTPMYNGKTKKIEKISGHVLCVVMDQPECRAVNGLLGGGSTSMPRFGYRADLSQFTHQISPCPDCWEKLIAVRGYDLWVPEPCNRCFNWMAGDIYDMKYNPPKNFPASEMTFTGKIGAKKIEYDDLTKAVEKCQKMILDMEWTTATGLAYLSANGIKSSLASKIIQCSANMLAYKTAVENHEVDPSEANRAMLQSVERLRGLEPEMYRECQLPPIWRSGLDIDQCPQATMHILFLGIVKKVVLWVQTWSTFRKKYRSLRQSLEDSTKKLEALGISWLKIEPYKGKKLGGWVSENFLGFSRVLPWVYAPLPRLAEDPPYVEPDKDMSKWTKKENIEWLRSRGLDLEGNAQIVRERVESNYGLPEIEPHGATVDQLQDLLLSLWNMISYLMGMENSSPDSVNVAHRHINLFLTHTYRYVRSMSLEEENKPAWLSSYNFICLLNLPDQIAKLGPVRNRYEGGVRGEGYLRRVKSLVNGTGRKRWQENLVTNLLQQNSISLLSAGPQLVLEDMDDDSSLSSSESDRGVKHEIELTSFKVYKSLAEVMGVMVNGKLPLSVVLSRKGGVFAIFYDGRAKMGRELKATSLPEYDFGFGYQKFEFVTGMPDLKLDELGVDCYGVLLPSFTSTVRYALITSTWNITEHFPAPPTAGT